MRGGGGGGMGMAMKLGLRRKEGGGKMESLAAGIVSSVSRTERERVEREDVVRRRVVKWQYVCGGDGWGMDGR